MIFHDPTGARKRHFILTTLGIAVAVVGLIAYGVWHFSYAEVGRRAPVASINWDDPRFEKTVALTFDDGPHPDYTPQLLELLEKEQVTATFFLMGEQVVRNPGLARDIAERHEIGNHTFSHSRRAHISPERLRREIVATDRAIAAATGKTTVLYRPPFLMDIDFGEVDGRLIQNKNLRTVEKMGLMAVGADVDPADWAADSNDAGMIYNRIIAGVASGGQVILLHDHGGDGATIEALEQFIPRMKAEGYRFVPVSHYFGLAEGHFVRPYEFMWSEHLAAAVLFAGVGGSTLVHVLMLAVIAVTLVRVWSIVVARRVLVPALARRSMTPEENAKMILPVSVVIPAYNEAANIEATIRSVFTGPIPAQVIVIDDGSTDGTGHIVERLATEYASRITLIQQAQSGSKALALAAALPLVAHDIIISIDADTVLAHDTLARLVRHFDDPHIGAVAGKIYPARTQTIVEKFQYLEYLQGQNLDKVVFSLGNAVGIVPGAIGAWRTSAVRESGGYVADTVVEDQDLTLALLAHGWRVYFDAHAIAYTETPASMRSFLRQRLRWIFGTLQCAYKYRAWTCSFERPWLGFIVLPNLMLFNIAIPLIAPLIDGLVIAGLFGAFDARALFIAFVFFLALDILYAIESLLHEKHPRYDFLPLIIPQRIFYRYAMAFTVARSVIAALSGHLVKWGTLNRHGAALRAFDDMHKNGARGDGDILLLNPEPVSATLP